MSTHFSLPHITSLADDFAVHDLAADAAEILGGTFDPSGHQIMLEVEAAYSFLGNARAALILYVGQPAESGSRLYGSGGQPLPGAEWYSVGSINGESSWAHTTARKIVLNVDPARPVTWQLLAAIIGGSGTVQVPAPRSIAISPDGVKAFVTSPLAGLVTPILLGRHGYSYDHAIHAQDEGQAPVECAGPTHVSAGNAYAIVSNDAADPHLSILAVADNRLVRRVQLAGAGAPLGSAIAPDGSFALVGTAGGSVARVTLPTGEVDMVQLGGQIIEVAIAADGVTAFVADAERGTIHRLHLPDLSVESSIPVDNIPHGLQVSPDGLIWVLCRPSPPAPGRLKGIDPRTNAVAHDHTLPFDSPCSFSIVPVADQSSQVVRTAWVVYDGGRFGEFYIGGAFAGQSHAIHCGTFPEGGDIASGVAVNYLGEIWVVQPDLDRVWKWPGGRLLCRAGADRPYPGIFFGEYCQVLVYGAREG